MFPWITSATNPELFSVRPIRLALCLVRVNTIAPGMINTPLFAGLPQDSIDSLSAAVLYPQRLGTPEEIGKLAAAIIDNDYINGETIRMDGGIRMQPR